jgi:serine/threonine protein kinase
MGSDRESTSELEGTPYEQVGDHPLGKGAMGVVYAARHRLLGTSVVVKILRADIESPELVKRMRVEAQALAHLKSSHIPTCSDFGFTRDGFPYLVTERLHGATLQDRLAHGPPIGPPEAFAIVRQLLLALHVAHQAGVVHRDIKPSNIFLCEDGPVQPFVKLIDFGVVKVLNDAGGITAQASRTATGVFVGTPRWAAPEQVAGGKIDARADLYVVLLVLYRLLAGRGAFDHHKAPGDLMLAQALEAPQPPSAFEPSISPEIDRVVLCGLEKDPGRRYQTAYDVLQALGEVGPELAMTPTPARAGAAAAHGGEDPTTQPWAGASPPALARSAADDPTAVGESLDRTEPFPAPFRSGEPGDREPER